MLVLPRYVIPRPVRPPLRPRMSRYFVTLAFCCLAASTWAVADVHVVKDGETLGKIAREHRVSLTQLRRWNGINGDHIIRGQRLQMWADGKPNHYVVRKGDTLSEIAVRFAVTTRRLRQLNDLRGDRIYPGGKLMLRQPPAPPPSRGRGKIHLVKKGDTLSGIARSHALSVDRLRKLNGLVGDTITLGQRLTVAEPEEQTEYVVKKGDTLSEIVRRFDVGLALLRQLNNLPQGRSSDRIRPGQKLKLRPAAEDEGIHIVRTGETLSEIAGRFKIKLTQLRDLNGIEGSRILVGQKLRLKTAPKATHIVEKGDALWEIARAYSMTVAEVQDLNGLESSRIYPGQVLNLNAEKAQRLSNYRVKGGDYLGEIARLHQMSVAELKQLNNLEGSVIHPGEVLKVRPLLSKGTEWLKISEIDWDGLMAVDGGVRKIAATNGPYYYKPPKLKRQKSATYFQVEPRSPLKTYKQARTLWRAFEREVVRLGRLSNQLEGWHLVLDPGHGGIDPGTVVETLDGNGKKLYVVEDEYVYDIAMRVYVLLKLHGADVTMTLLSPNHLIRHTSRPADTFVNQKNEVYNSYSLNKSNSSRAWPRGGPGGNLGDRVKIARKAFANTPVSRRIFLSFHADNEAKAPEAPLALYYENSRGRNQDRASRDFARIMLPALGAGARTRGQPLGVLRDNPAGVKLLLELRNLAYTNNAWSLRFEQYRHRDAEKVVKGVLDYARARTRVTARH